MQPDPLRGPTPADGWGKLLPKGLRRVQPAEDRQQDDGEAVVDDHSDLLLPRHDRADRQPQLAGVHHQDIRACLPLEHPV